MASNIKDMDIPVVVLGGDGKLFRFPDPEAAGKFESDAQAAGGATVRLAPLPSPAARTLYDIETHLAALVDCEESVPAELQEEYGKELQATMLAAVAKRDRVGQFMAHLETQIGLAAAEIQRLQDRKALFTRALDHIKLYVTRVVESLGLDDKGKRKKLEGSTVTFNLHGCDKRINILNEGLVPAKYKRITVTLPAEAWTLVCDCLDLDLRDQLRELLKSTKSEVNMAAAKADLKAGLTVEGCELTGGYYLERK